MCDNEPPTVNPVKGERVIVGAITYVACDVKNKESSCHQCVAERDDDLCELLPHCAVERIIFKKLGDLI